MASAVVVFGEVAALPKFGDGGEDCRRRRVQRRRQVAIRGKVAPDCSAGDEGGEGVNQAEFGQ